MIESKPSKTITPYDEFQKATVAELAEKLLKASCCYCYYGQGGEMTCSNNDGAHCKAGILAYLAGKTID